jgi:hypothetical protein
MVFQRSGVFCSDGGCGFVETVIGQRTVRELALRHKDDVRERGPKATDTIRVFFLFLLQLTTNVFMFYYLIF